MFIHLFIKVILVTKLNSVSWIKLNSLILSLYSMTFSFILNFTFLFVIVIISIAQNSSTVSTPSFSLPLHTQLLTFEYMLHWK